MGATVDLILTSAEVEHLAYTIDCQEDYPVGTMMAGGEDFRLKFLRAFRGLPQANYMFALTRPELWLLDTKLLRPDPRGAKLPDGTPVLGLLTKIWDALLESYAEKGTGHARDADNYPDAHHANHGAAPAVETV